MQIVYLSSLNLAAQRIVLEMIEGTYISLPFATSVTILMIISSTKVNKYLPFGLSSPSTFEFSEIQPLQPRSWQILNSIKLIQNEAGFITATYPKIII